MHGPREATTEIAENPRAPRSYLRGSARKEDTDSTVLYGCVRTDDVMHAKSKREG